MASNESKPPRSLTLPQCLLKNFWLLGLQGELRRNRLIRLCTVVWPRYKLDNDPQWPPEGSLQYQILTDLDNFCYQLGRWGEIPYVMAFWDLRSRPNLWSSCPSACVLLARPQPPKDPTSPTSPISNPLEDLATPPTGPRPPPYSQPPAVPPSPPISSRTRAQAPPREQTPVAILPSPRWQDLKA